MGLRHINSYITKDLSCKRTGLFKLSTIGLAIILTNYWAQTQQFDHPKSGGI
jgi:hypothetical protein